MAGHRRDRINEQLAKELADILRTIKDPRVSSRFVSITGAECSADLKTAKIFYSSIDSGASGGSSPTGEDELKKGLASAAGYIRSQIAERLNLRITPELRFIRDESIEKGARMSALLRNIRYSDSGEPPREDK